MEAYILDVLHISSGRASMDLGTDYGYTFSFSRSGITETGIKNNFL